MMTVTTEVSDPAREKGIQEYRKKLIEHREVEAKLKEGKILYFCLVM